MHKGTEVTKEQLIEIIKGIEARGENASELRRQLEALSAPTESMARVTRALLSVERVVKRELTTEERLQSYGIPSELHKSVIEMDEKYSLEELRALCREKGLATTGDKKKLASSLMRKRRKQMESKEWTAKAGDQLRMPEQYLKGLKYEILVLSSKKVFTFRCVSYDLTGQTTIFHHVIIDTSMRNARGDITLHRVSYHEQIILANVGFMAIPVPESEASETLES